MGDARQAKLFERGPTWLEVWAEFRAGWYWVSFRFAEAASSRRDSGQRGGITRTDRSD